MFFFFAFALIVAYVLTFSGAFTEDFKGFGRV